MIANVNIGALMTSLGMDISEFEDALKEAKREMERAEETVSEGTQKMQKDFEKLGKKIKRVGSQMKSVGNNLSMFITAPLLAAGGAALKAEMDFEAAMTKIVSLVGVGQKQVNAWREDLLSMSGEVARSPQKLGEALYFITSAGMRGSQALDVLRQSAQASAVGMGETKVVADLVTDAMNAFGKENLSASQAMDELVNAVRLGKVEAQDLVVSMGHALPVAAELGVQFHDVAGAIAAMTRTGTPAETAAVQLRQVLSQLMGQSKESETAFRTLSNAMDGTEISAKDLRETMVNEGLFAALKKFDDAIEDVGGYDMADKIFGNIRALTSVMDLMGKNVEDNAMIFEEMANSAGRAERAFEIVQGTLKFKWQQAMADAQNALIAFGKELKKAAIPLLEDLSDMLRRVAEWFSTLSDEEKKATLIKIGLAAAIGPVLSVLGNLTIVIGGATMAFGKLSKAVVAAKTAIKGMSATSVMSNIGKIAKGIGAWGTALGLIVTLSIPQFKKDISDAAKEVDTLLKSLDNAQGADLGKGLIDKVEAIPANLKAGREELKKMYGQIQSFNTEIESPTEIFKQNLGGWSLKQMKGVQAYLDEQLVSLAHQLQHTQAQGKELDAINNKVERYTLWLSLINKELVASNELANKLKGKYEEQDNFFKQLKGNVTAAMDAIKERGKLDLGQGFDVAQEQADLLISKINELLGPEHQFKVDSQEVQWLLDLLEQINGQLGQSAKGVEQLGMDIANAFVDVEEQASALKIIGKEMDVDAEKAAVLEEMMEKVLDGEYGTNLIDLFKELNSWTSQFNLNLGNTLSILEQLRKDLQLEEQMSQLLDGSHVELLTNKINMMSDALRKMVESGEYSAAQVKELSIQIRGLKKELDYAQAIREQVQIQEEAIFRLTSVLGKGIFDAGNFMTDLYQMIGTFMQQIGKSIVKTSAAWQAFKESLFTAPGVGIGIGLGLIAAGAALASYGNSLNSNQDSGSGSIAMADGGLAYGPTNALVGEYPGASANPEVVAPLNDLKSMIGDRDQSFGNVKFEIEGYTLKGILQKVQKKDNRM